MPKDSNDIDVKAEFQTLQEAFAEFKRTHNEALQEKADKNSVDTLLEEKMERIQEDLNAKQQLMDQVSARLQRIAKGAGGDAGPEEAKRADAMNRWLKTAAHRRQEAAEKDYDLERLAEYKSAQEKLLRKGADKLTPEETKALSVGSDPDGGYLVDPDTSGRMVMRIFETSPVRQYAAVQSIGSDALEGTYDDDEASSGWVGETESRPETGTPQLGQWRIPTHEQYAEPRATQKVLDDAGVDLEAWLNGKVADKFARQENTAFVNGNGVNKPRGFLTYPDYTSPGVYQRGAIERFATGVDGNFAADPDGGDVLLDAIYGLKAPYRANANFFMNRVTTKGVRKLKDNDGQYLWQPGLAPGQPSTLLGYPVASLEDMPDYTTTDALAIAFGDMRAAYQIVDRLGIRILRDPYTAKPFIKFYTVKRVGGDVLNFESLKLIEFTA